MHALTDLVPEIAPDQLDFRDVPDADWVRAWMDTFQPMQFGRRLWIYPWTIEPPAGAGDDVVVRLDPGLAFGTGTHPSTALCLDYLARHRLDGYRVLDYGCGSGILAIAALKLGADAAVAYDIDPQAIQATRDNAGVNGVLGKLHAIPHDQTLTPFGADLVLANILAQPLISLAPLLASSAKRGSTIVLAGLLDRQADEVRAAYQKLEAMTFAIAEALYADPAAEQPPG